MTLVIALTSQSWAMHRASSANHSIIPGASYYVTKDVREIRRGKDVIIRHVTYFSFNGDAITTIELGRAHYGFANRKLDPEAPRPQPVSFKMKYLQNDGFLSEGGAWQHAWINFYDRHNNLINNFDTSFSQNPRDIMIFYPAKDADDRHITRSVLLDEALCSTEFPLDLSIVEGVAEGAPADVVPSAFACTIL